MAMSAEHKSKFEALHRQWWHLEMSEKFSNGTKTPNKQILWKVKYLKTIGLSIKFHEIVSKAFSKLMIDIYPGIFLSFVNFMRPCNSNNFSCVSLWSTCKTSFVWIYYLKFVSFNQLYIHIIFYIWYLTKLSGARIKQIKNICFFLH